MKRSQTKTIDKKPEWNSYLTDEQRYRMTPEEQMRKKDALVSPHNRLVHGKRAVKKRMKPSGKVRPSTNREAVEGRSLREEMDCPISSSKKSKGGITDRKRTASSSKRGKKVQLAPARRVVRKEHEEELEIEERVHRQRSRSARSREFGLTSFETSRREEEEDDGKSTIRPSPQPVQVFDHIQDISTHPDLVEAWHQIRLLSQEMCQFQRLMNNNDAVCGFDGSELSMFFEDEGQLGTAHPTPSLTGLIRALTSLVSQSMTFVLSAQLKVEEERKQRMTLSAQLEEVVRSFSVYEESHRRLNKATVLLREEEDEGEEEEEEEEEDEKFRTPSKPVVDLLFARGSVSDWQRKDDQAPVTTTLEEPAISTKETPSPTFTWQHYEEEEDEEEDDVCIEVPLQTRFLTSHLESPLLEEEEEEEGGGMSSQESTPLLYSRVSIFDPSHPMHQQQQQQHSSLSSSKLLANDETDRFIQAMVSDLQKTTFSTPLKKKKKSGLDTPKDITPKNSPWDDLSLFSDDEDDHSLLEGTRTAPRPMQPPPHPKATIF